ncbi:hypothetical protein EP47_04940 [Legionella norrlandica]|uniref:Uncharacterized protein n=1 Tax=Legionella norrlandica TaxID=1498499 RepID=A0A0A2SSI1_9GAMM|nr:flagellar export chaperone FliS [Legionella norrlandica]KGP63712.1 hypothetical protein EP47_04940 [Legionella norrlandica]
MNHINTYKDINLTSEILGAPHYRHISILLERLLQNINGSLLAISENNITLKCKLLSNSYDIVSYFIDCLDFNADLEMAKKLEGIYSHLQKLFFWANAKGDLTKLNEAKFITENLITWWSKVNESRSLT